MKYQSEIGKIYDTLFFCIEYFNNQAIKETLSNQFTDTSFMDDCYNEIKRNVSPLPEILTPLFMYKDRTPTAMTAFFTKYIDYPSDTIDSFIQKIISQQDDIYTGALASLFPGETFAKSCTAVSIKETDEFIRILDASNYPEDLKYKIALFFGNFGYTVTKLTEHLLEIYHEVDTLHNRYQNKISAECKQIYSERNTQLYKQILSLDENADNCFSVSLLNPYITHPINLDGIIYLLLGINHEDSLILHFNSDNIDLDKLFISVGNETRLTILHVLAEEQELTATEIAKKIDTPLTTVLRHIEILFNNCILFVSKRSGLQIFYKINYNMLAKASKLFNCKIGDLINEQTDKEKSTDQMG